jgi:pimeloyl-ACP methyl ester carboxylesterase
LALNRSTAVLDDLRDRLRGTRWPDQVGGAGWDYGTDTEVLRSFVDHCSTDTIGPPSSSGWPPLTTSASTSTVLGHARRPRAGAPSRRTSGAAAAGVAAPSEPGMDVARIAQIVVDVMAQRGYPRFAARGSDLGAGVLQQPALAHPERLIALHLSGTNPYLASVPDDLSKVEKAFVAAAERWNQTEMAYAMEHASSPRLSPMPQRLPGRAGFLGCWRSSVAGAIVAVTWTPSMTATTFRTYRSSEEES